MPLLSGLEKRPQGILGSFQSCFWNLFSSSGWSQICKIRNVWKLRPILQKKALKRLLGVLKNLLGVKLSNKFQNGQSFS
jgi:hypothetical protein